MTSSATTEATSTIFHRLGGPLIDIADITHVIHFDLPADGIPTCTGRDEGRMGRKAKSYRSLHPIKNCFETTYPKLNVESRVLGRRSKGEKKDKVMEE
jgi:superfamily II DNA/RNA helicase